MQPSVIMADIGEEGEGGARGRKWAILPSATFIHYCVTSCNISNFFTLPSAGKGDTYFVFHFAKGALIRGLALN